MNEDDELLLITDEESDNIINDLKDELILESIMVQIDKPFSSGHKNTDYLDIFETRYNYLITVYAESVDFVNKITEIKMTMYSEIFHKITTKYGIEYTDGNFDLCETVKYLYHFFCLDYQDNIVQYIVATIRHDKKSLSALYTESTFSKSLSANALKKVLKNRDEAIIIANLKDVVDTIISQDMDSLDVIKKITEEDAMEATNYKIYKYFLTDFILAPPKNFAKLYFEILYDKGEGYSTIINEIRTILYNYAPKKK